MKILIVVVLVLVIGALASAGLFMLRRDRRSGSADGRMVRSLAIRVGLSIALFLFILLSWRLGWIQPGGLPVGR